MLNHKKIISEAIAKHFRHAKQGLKDILSPGGELDDLKDDSRYVHPYTHGGFTPREMADASTETHTQLLKSIFGMPLVGMGPPGRPVRPNQVFTINRIAEIQGPKPPNFRYSSLGYVKIPKQRSVTLHSMRRADYKINRSIDRLLAKHPGADHPNAPIFNAQINSHLETLGKLADAETTLRKGALSDVGHPYDEQFYDNFEGNAPRVRAQLSKAIGEIDAAGKLLGRRAVMPPLKALPPGLATEQITKENMNMKSFSSFLSEASSKIYRQAARLLRDAEGLALGANAASNLASLPYASKADFLRGAMIDDILAKNKINAAADKLRTLQLKKVMRASRIAQRRPLAPMPTSGGIRFNSQEMNDALAKHVALDSHRAGQLALATRQLARTPPEFKRSEMFPQTIYDVSLATSASAPKYQNFPEKYALTSAELGDNAYMNRLRGGDRAVLRDLAFKHSPAMTQIFNRVAAKPTEYPNIDTILLNASQMRLPIRQRRIKSIEDLEDLQNM